MEEKKREEWSKGRKRRGKKTVRNEIHFYSHSNALISGHPSGLTPGTYRGIAWDLLSFVANFSPGGWHWSAFALPRQDTWGKTSGICDIATILKISKPKVKVPL